MRKHVIPLFCCFHFLVITWWTLPHTFGNLVLAEENTTTLQYKLFKVMSGFEKTRLTDILEAYVNLTGSQQYWDFFAPHSSRFHQYLSVCSQVEKKPAQEALYCSDKPFFSNLPGTIGEFLMNGSNLSREYRLTENLIAINDTALISAFARYYHRQSTGQQAMKGGIYVLAHQFELFPKLKTLPKSGYRSDKLLSGSP